MPFHPKVSTLEIETHRKSQVCSFAVGKVEVDVKEAGKLPLLEIRNLADIVQSEAYLLEYSFITQRLDQLIEVGVELLLVEHHRTERKE